MVVGVVLRCEGQCWAGVARGFGCLDVLYIRVLEEWRWLEWMVCVYGSMYRLYVQDDVGAGQHVCRSSNCAASLISEVWLIVQR
jgi:hypothetical protein